MQNENQNLIDQVLLSVSQQGAEGDVLITEEAQLGLKCHQGELSEYKVTSSRTVGVRVICGDQVGTSYSESTEATDLQNMVQAALANAKYSKQSPTEKITAVPQETLDWSDEIYRPDHTPQKDKIELALSLEDGRQRAELPLHRLAVDARALHVGRRRHVRRSPVNVCVGAHRGQGDGGTPRCTPRRARSEAVDELRVRSTGMRCEPKLESPCFHASI